MQTDFLMLKAILSSCPIVEQRWLSSFLEEESIAAGGGHILFGDPTVQRVELPRLLGCPVECFPQNDLRHAFTEGLTEMARRTTPKERLLIAFFCHGQIGTGSLKIGQRTAPSLRHASSLNVSTSATSSYITTSGSNLMTSGDLAEVLQRGTVPNMMRSLSRAQGSTTSASTSTSAESRLATWFSSDDLDKALEPTNAPITVISSSCFAGNLGNPAKFSLLAGSSSTDESDSLIESESGKCRGGRFMYALADSLLAEFGARLPTPTPLDLDLSSQHHLSIPVLLPGISYTNDERVHRLTFLGRKKYVEEHPILSCRPTKMTMIKQDAEDSHLPALSLPLTFPAVQFVAPNPSTRFDSNDDNSPKTAAARQSASVAIRITAGLHL